MAKTCLSFGRAALTAKAMVLALGSVVGVPASAEDVLHVTNWAEYIGEDTIADFEKEFGIKVVYDNYDSVEAIDSKLLAGNTGYDVVLHLGSQIVRLIPAEILQPLDKSKIPNLANAMPEIMDKIAEEWDPGNRYMVPYMWGTHGVTYNKELVLKTYPEAPIGSMDLILDPEHLSKVASCGVALLDSPTDVVPMVLAHLGLPPSTTKRADYEKVGDLLSKMRPHIKTFDNYAYQRMPQKEFCIAFTWGPDGLLAMSGAKEANTGVVLDFFAPAGARKAKLWVDGWVIPSDARNIDGAYTFLNYMLRPEVGAADSNFTWYATANAAALPMVDEDVSGNTASYPLPEQVADMYTLSSLPQRAAKVRTRVWTDFKAGR